MLPLPPPETVLVAPILRDDLVVTDYHLVEWDRFHSTWEPAIPQEATRLEVSVRGSSERVCFELSAADDRDPRNRVTVTVVVESATAA
jgi:hypothetical protein